MKNSQNILLLEDDLALNATIKQFLEYNNYNIFTAFDALEAKDILYEKNIDLMLLDIKVPYQNGFDLLSEIRKDGNQSPAIFITSLNSVDDVTKGFKVGCDDYIRKPFALKELLVRVEVLLKRDFGSIDDIIDLGDGFIFNIKELSLSKNNIQIPLKKKEINLLSLFLKHKNNLTEFDFRASFYGFLSKK